KDPFGGPHRLALLPRAPSAVSRGVHQRSGAWRASPRDRRRPGCGLPAGVRARTLDARPFSGPGGHAAALRAGGVDVRRRSPTARARDAQMTILRVPAVEVVRGGRTRPLFPTSARVSNLPANWDGMALEVSRIVPWVVPDHEHPTHLL